MIALRTTAVILLLSMVLLISGCSNTKPQPTVPNENLADNSGEVKPLPIEGAKDEKAAKYMSIKIYFATKDAAYLVPQAYVVDKNDLPAVTAINLLLKEADTKDFISVTPKGIKLIDLKIKNKIAYANFSKNIIKNGSGSAEEILLVAAIVNTLTEFPEIQKVQILVEGKVVDTIGGHIDVSEPLPRQENIIRK